jgi:hypothetical protein
MAKTQTQLTKTQAPETTALTVLDGDLRLGIDKIENEDLILPRILLMQGLSKFVSEEGKKPGEFVNSLTKESLPDPSFIPCAVTKYYDIYEWVGPEGDKKKQFVARVFDKNDEKLKGKLFFNDKKTGRKADVDTVLSFIVMIDGAPAIIPFSKTSYNGGKKLCSMIKIGIMAYKLPIFGKRYRLTATKDTNDKGTFFVKGVEEVWDKPVTQEELDLARQIATSYGTKANEINSAGVEGEEVPF